MQKVELLAPAGNFEKLEIAVHYGADAVYIGGKDFSLRNFSGNFTDDELATAVEFAQSRGVKVYVACNVYPRNFELQAIERHLTGLGEINPDAVILSDPGIIMIAKEHIPHIPIHISTQANTTNYKSALFWRKMGVKRINCARELSLSEIKVIASKSLLEIEAFVHGAMCISYSGRCLLSSFMANRDSNRGMCCHPCRWKYAVVEELRPGKYYPIAEDDHGSYIFNSKDLCMIRHIPELIESGIASFKIEGRMKGINYLATVVNVYREAIDLFYENPASSESGDNRVEDLAKISHRGYCTGFYLGNPEETAPNYSNLLCGTEYVFAGKVLTEAKEGCVEVDVRNRIFKGDKIEILARHNRTRRDRIADILDQEGASIPVAQPGSRVTLRLSTNCMPNDLLKKKIAVHGLKLEIRK